jgi:outer membrane protein assembly factor BamD
MLSLMTTADNLPPGSFSESKMMRTTVLFILAATLVFSGCAWFGTKPEKSAIELVSEGMDDYNRGNYKDAVKSFEQLKDWYPFSKYAILAELKIADSHYHLEEYEDAIFAYQEFENLHPRNEAIPYVIYQTGRCYFEQIDTIDRDQKPAKEAAAVFSRLIKQFPGDVYAKKAESHLKTCLKSLAGHEYYVGRFYFKSMHYKAALSRFRAVVTQYPDVGVHYKALQYITRCEGLIAEGAGAGPED